MKIYLLPKSILVFTLTLILGYLIAETYIDHHSPGNLLYAAKLTPAPDFTLKQLGGKSVSLSHFRGRYVFLNFWASWCLPCLEEMPSMEKLYRQFKSDRFEMLAVSLDRQGVTKVKPFVKEHGFTFPVLLDESNSTFDLFELAGIPATFILNPEGEIIEKLQGSRDWSKTEVFKYFDQLLNKE